MNIQLLEAVGLTTLGLAVLAALYKILSHSEKEYESVKPSSCIDLSDQSTTAPSNRSSLTTFSLNEINEGDITPPSDKNSLISLPLPDDSISNRNSMHFLDNSSTPMSGLNLRGMISLLQSLNIDLDTVSVDDILAKLKEQNILLDMKLLNSLIQTSFREEHSDLAFSIYKQASAMNLQNEDGSPSNTCFPNISTVNIVLKGLAAQIQEDGSRSNNNEILSKMDEVLEDTRNSSIEPNERTFNLFIEASVKSYDITKAFNYFDQMKKFNIKPDNITYTALIKGIKSRTTQPQKLPLVFALLADLEGRQDIQPDTGLYNCVIDACFKLGEPRRALDAFGLMRKQNITPSPVTFNTLIRGFGNIGDIEKVQIVYQKLTEDKPHINESNYVALIDAHINCNKIDEAFNLLHDLKRSSSSMTPKNIGSPSNRYLNEDDSYNSNTETYLTVIRRLAGKKRHDRALEVYAIMNQQPRVTPDLACFHALMECAIKCHRAEQFLGFYDEISKSNVVSPTIKTYSIYLKGLCRFRRIDEAHKLYKNITRNRMHELEESLFSDFMSGLVKAGQLNTALSVYEDMKKEQIEPTKVSLSVLINLHGQMFELSKAEEVFEKSKNMYGPDLVMYNCMAQAYIHNNVTSKALKLNEEMQRYRLKGDIVFYKTLINSLIDSNNKTVALETALKLLEKNIQLPKETYQALIGGPGKYFRSDSDKVSLPLKSLQMEEGQLIEDLSRMCRNKGISFDSRPRYHGGNSSNTTPKTPYSGSFGQRVQSQTTYRKSIY